MHTQGRFWSPHFLRSDVYDATGLIGMKHHSVKLNAVLVEFYSAILCLKKSMSKFTIKQTSLSPARNDNVPVEF